MERKTHPETLVEAIRTFADPDTALTAMVEPRWPDGVTCPTCGRKDARFLAKQRKWQCKSVHAHRQFSVKSGTIMEDSPLSLDKWLCAMWMLANCKNGVSSYEVHRALGITQKSAWFMLHRLRLAMQSGSLVKLGGGGGAVEVDERYIGGKARNMHKSRRRPGGTGMVGKAIVQGLLERHGEVRAIVVPSSQGATLRPNVHAHVEKGATVYTDALQSYSPLAADYAHEVIDHAEAYVKGNVHTNGLENFWSLLKRGIKGTYVAVEPFHLFRYVDEQAFPVQQPQGHGWAAVLKGDGQHQRQAIDVQGSDRRGTPRAGGIRRQR